MDVSFDPTSPQYGDALRAADVAVDLVLERRLAGMVDGSYRVCAANVSSDEIASRFASCELPAAGCPPEHYLAMLERKGLHDEMMLQSPHMLGHMSGAIPPWTAPLGRLVHAMHANVVKTETAKVATAVERETIAMMHRAFFGFDAPFYARHAHDPALCLGHATSGGTTANLEALWLARNLALPAAEQRGLVAALREGGWADAVIITSSLAHYSVTAKACGVLGIGTDNVLALPTDAALRVDLAAMRAALERCAASRHCVLAIVAVAGSTDCGSFDDIERIGALASEFKTWLHVDAAWGGGLIFGTGVPATLLRGVELADSITVDAHKQLLTPLGFGMVLYRDPSAVVANAKSASYIIRADSHDLGRFTLEGSRPASAYFLHMNLLVLGRHRLAALVDRKLALARELAAALTRAADFDLLLQPAADILLLRYVPAQLAARLESARAAADPAAREAVELELDCVQRRVQEAQKARGVAFLSRTAVLDPRAARGAKSAFLRAVINVQATLPDALAVLDDVRRTYELLSRGDDATGGGGADAAAALGDAERAADLACAALAKSATAQVALVCSSTVLACGATSPALPAGAPVRWPSKGIMKT
jgi:glutamate decarboxylase